MKHPLAALVGSISIFLGITKMSEAVPRNSGSNSPAYEIKYYLGMNFPS